MSAPGMLRFRAANQRADWRDPWPDYERLLSTVRELDGRYRAALSLYGSALQHEDRPALLSEARRLLIDLGTAPQVRDPEKAVRPIAASSTGPAMLATLTRLKYLALYNAGMIAAELGQHGQAIETLLQAVAVSPERISAWSAVAQSASATGNYRLCKTACEAVLKIEPKDDDGAVVDMLIRTLYIVDNVPAAAQLYAAYGPNAFSPEIRVLMDELVGQVSATAAAQQELEFTPNQHTLLAPAAQQRLKQLKQAHRTHREKEAAESAVPLSCRTIEIEADISWKALAKLLSQTCQDVWKCHPNASALQAPVLVALTEPSLANASMEVHVASSATPPVPPPAAAVDEELMFVEENSKLPSSFDGVGGSASDQLLPSSQTDEPEQQQQPQDQPKKRGRKRKADTLAATSSTAAVATTTAKRSERQSEQMKKLNRDELDRTERKRNRRSRADDPEVRPVLQWLLRDLVTGEEPEDSVLVAYRASIDKSGNSIAQQPSSAASVAPIQLQKKDSADRQYIDEYKRTLPIAFLEDKSDELQALLAAWSSAPRPLLDLVLEFLFTMTASLGNTYWGSDTDPQETVMFLQSLVDQVLVDQVDELLKRWIQLNDAMEEENAEVARVTDDLYRLFKHYAVLLEFQCSEAVPLLERLLAVLADDRGEPEWKARVYWLFALRAEAARDAGFAKLCLDRCGGYLTDANDRIILANRIGSDVISQVAIKEHSGLLLSHDGPRNVDELCQVFFATASDSGEVDERMQANRRMMSPATNFFDKKTMLSRWLETFEDAEARLGTSTVRERFLCLAALTIMLFDNHGAMTINVFLEEVALLLHKLWPILSASPAENGRVFFSLLSPSSPMAKHWATALVDWVALSHEMIKNHHNTVVEEPAIAPLPPKQDDNDDEREREQDVSEEPVKPEATAASGATADKENMALPWIIFTMFISWREKELGLPPNTIAASVAEEVDDDVDNGSECPLGKGIVRLDGDAWASPSARFMMLAHDQLGSLGACWIDDGYLLHLALDAFTAVAPDTDSDIAIAQCCCCLFGMGSFADENTYHDHRVGDEPARHESVWTAEVARKTFLSVRSGLQGILRLDHPLLSLDSELLRRTWTSLKPSPADLAALDQARQGLWTGQGPVELADGEFIQDMLELIALSWTFDVTVKRPVEGVAATTNDQEVIALAHRIFDHLEMALCIDPSSVPVWHDVVLFSKDLVELLKSQDQSRLSGRRYLQIQLARDLYARASLFSRASSLGSKAVERLLVLASPESLAQFETTSDELHILRAELTQMVLSKPISYLLQEESADRAALYSLVYEDLSKAHQAIVARAEQQSQSESQPSEEKRGPGRKPKPQAKKPVIQSKVQFEKWELGVMWARAMRKTGRPMDEYLETFYECAKSKNFDPVVEYPLLSVMSKLLLADPTLESALEAYFPNDNGPRKQEPSDQAAPLLQRIIARLRRSKRIDNDYRIAKIQFALYKRGEYAEGLSDAKKLLLTVYFSLSKKHKKQMRTIRSYEFNLKYISISEKCTAFLLDLFQEGGDLEHLLIVTRQLYQPLEDIMRADALRARAKAVVAAMLEKQLEPLAPGSADHLALLSCPFFRSDRGKQLRRSLALLVEEHKDVDCTKLVEDAYHLVVASALVADPSLPPATDVVPPEPVVEKASRLVELFKQLDNLPSQ